ncbi:aminotransferase class I/II-fold pyridoxal phosphate-dependent enzyme [Jeotgalibaca caeni]|uniref:aminotransferase class I/II-fold pyridoxal phosphate-dependent enzyme n=1 Tax=Jeotgalibaca caeni TaxID=3028623 RepID=UPI00237D9E7A|nr:aminotransferase class I/II-fold pyridoxal phosphate-dependent enzyme [Jeotgalibaca caeni]MDE1547641.1 aminotransferase class I/II-fold pyridoxal phosphate-dependent enzyme [Jeotgalibaca caeni]
MRNPLNQKVQEIKPSGIRRFFEIANEIPGVISLGVGEPDFATPWIVRDEAMYTLQKGNTFYTANAGLMELRQEISNYLYRRYDLSYGAKNEILVTVGGSEAIDLALRAMLDPGDEVIIPEPCYVSYVPCVALADGVPVTINLQEKHQFRLQADELEAAITPKTKILMLSYPNNPTGAIMEQADLEAIAEVVKKHDLYVISDEIYSELSYGEDHISIASLPGMKERTILINGFSKSFAMTGWRLGYAAGPKVIMQQMVKIHQFAIMAAPTASQYAGIVAIRDCDREVSEMRESYNQRRRYLMNALSELGLPCFEPYGAFYIFPNISEFGLTSEEFATQLVQEEKVAVVPGSAFGESGEGFIRISYAYSIEELKEAFIRVGRFIERLRSK